jgi:hypothetical protein
LDPRIEARFLQIAQRGSTIGSRTRLVGDEILEPDTSMPPGLLERDVAGLEETDESGATDTQEVGGLLSRHRHPLRYDGDPLARGQGIGHLIEDAEDLVGDRARFALRIDESSVGRILCEMDLKLSQDLGKIEQFVATSCLG